MTDLALRADSAPVPAQQQSAPAMLTAWAEAAQAAHRLAAPLVTTDFVPSHFRPRGTSEEALRVAQASATAAVLCGAEIGLSPMQALQGIYVISGRPALYARTMHAVVLSAGHQVWTEESTDTRAVVCGQRRGSSTTERVVVTMDQARKAGWTTNKKYASEPATMLWARAVSTACRRVAPDALVGMAYSAEEIEDEQPAPTTTMQREAGEDSPRRARRAQPTPPPTPEPDLQPEVAPEPDPAAPSRPETGEQITDAQSKKLHALLNGVGLGDRDQGLARIGAIVGHDIDTSKALTKREATLVIDVLQGDEQAMFEGQS